MEKRRSFRNFATARLLDHALMEDSFQCEFYLEVPPRGILSNFLYITDVTKSPISTITADDNGGYVKQDTLQTILSRDETKSASEESGKLYNNVK